MGAVCPARAQRTPLADPARVATLRATGLLGGQKVDAFDRLANLAARFVGAPIAMVTLLDDTHLHALSRVGPPDLAKSGRAPVKDTFCQHVVASTEPLIVDDAREHELTKGLAVVKSGKVLAYAGIPLRLPSGHVRRDAVRRRRHAARLEARGGLGPRGPRAVGRDRDRDARRRRGAPAGRDRPPALQRPPPQPDGQQPRGDLRAGPRGAPPLPQRSGRAPRHRRAGSERPRAVGDRGRRAGRARGAARAGRRERRPPLGQVPAHRPGRRALRHLRHRHRHHRAQAHRGRAARGAAALRQRVRARADRDGDDRHRRALPPGQRRALRPDRPQRGAAAPDDARRHHPPRGVGGAQAAVRAHADRRDPHAPDAGPAARGRRRAALGARQRDRADRHRGLARRVLRPVPGHHRADPRPAAAARAPRRDARARAGGDRRAGGAAAARGARRQPRLGGRHAVAGRRRERRAAARRDLAPPRVRGRAARGGRHAAHARGPAGARDPLRRPGVDRGADGGRRLRPRDRDRRRGALRRRLPADPHRRGLPRRDRVLLPRARRARRAAARAAGHDRAADRPLHPAHQDRPRARRRARRGARGDRHEVAVPRQHEPRAAHADERRDRDGRAAARHGADRRAAGLRRRWCAPRPTPC